jgi:hypothetical protein
MDVNEVDAAIKDLMAALERDREGVIQRSPVHRRDFDNAIGTVQTLLDHMKHGRTDSVRNVWTKSVALRAISRNYDDEFCRVSAALQ